MEPLSREDFRKLIQERASQLGIDDVLPQQEAAAEPLYAQDVKRRAEANQVPEEEIYAADEALLNRSKPISSACLKPDEILLLFTNPGKLQLARVAHLETCPSCRLIGVRAELSPRRAEALAARLASVAPGLKVPPLPAPSRLSVWIDRALARLNDAPQFTLRWGSAFAVAVAVVFVVNVAFFEPGSSGPGSGAGGSSKGEASTPDIGMAATIFYKAGRLDLERGNADSAHALADRAIAADPQNPDAYVLRAGAAWRMGKRNEADADLARAAEVADDPSLKKRVQDCQARLRVSGSAREWDLWASYSPPGTSPSERGTGSEIETKEVTSGSHRELAPRDAAPAPSKAQGLPAQGVPPK